MYPILLTDIDGTLLKSDLTISDNTKKAFAKLQDNGTRIVLCSGRYIQGVSFLADELGIKNPIYSALNGALIKDGDQYIHSERISKEAYEIAMKIIRGRAKSIMAFSESHYSIESDDEWYEIQRRICRQCGIRMDQSSYDETTKALGEPIYKILLKNDDAEEKRKLMDEVQKALEGKALIVSSFSTNFEILPLGTDKRNAVRILSQHFSISPSEIIAFGDWDNDAGMLEDAGLGIAMGNGSEKAKKSARYITLDNDHDGIYHALKHFELI